MILKMRFWMLCLCILLPVTAHAQTNAGIAAIVNDNVITNSDVQSRVSLALQGSHGEPSPAVLKDLQHQALQSLIEEQIRMTEVKRLNIDVTAADIDDGIAKLADQNNIPVDKFRELIGDKPDVLRSLRDQIKTQVGWGKLVRQKITTAG